MNRETLIVGAGCFWCVEAQFADVRGVLSVESGYAGGDSPNVTYAQVCSGRTGHAEVIRIEFDADLISRTELLRLFLVAHDPTQKDRQGPDVGTQYRSVVFYANESERECAERVIAEVSKEGIFDAPIVTTIEPLRNYTRAEPEHQEYFRRFEEAPLLTKMGMNMGYCQAVVAPKVAKFRREHRARLVGTPTA